MVIVEAIFGCVPTVDNYEWVLLLEYQMFFVMAFIAFFAYPMMFYDYYVYHREINQKLDLEEERKKREKKRRKEEFCENCQFQMNSQWRNNKKDKKKSKKDDGFR